MSRFGGGHCHGNRLCISKLADQDYVRIFTHGGTDSVCEADNVRSDLTLNYLALLTGVNELNGVFEADNVQRTRSVQVVNHCRESCRLTGSCRPRDQHHSLMVVTKLLQDGRHIKLVQRGNVTGNESKDGTRPGCLLEDVDTKTTTFFGNV